MFKFRRHWSRYPLVPVLVSGIIGTVAFVLFMLTSEWGVGWNGVFMGVAGAGVCAPDALLGGSVAVSLGEADGRNAGAAVTGLINGCGSLGAVLEGPLVGYVSDRYGWNAMFVLIIALSSFGSVCVFKACLTQKRHALRGKSPGGLLLAEEHS